jgi:hypothetical protein
MAAMNAITTELVETGEKRDARGRRIAARREREALIAAYERSGLTQRAFAQREGIGFYRFVAWLKRHRDGRLQSKFAEVSIAGNKRLTPPSAVEVALPNGVVVRGGDVEQMVALVERLRRC